MMFRVTVAPDGRLTLPLPLRKRLGLAQGGAVLVEQTADGLVLRNADRAVSRAQTLARRHTEGMPDAGSNAFIARRRVESGA